MSAAAPSAPGALDGLSEADLHLKMINEDYKAWKKNTPFLYDLVMTDVLEWPTLTLQWLPDKTMPPGKDYSVQRLLAGTHAYEGGQNYVQILEVRLPLTADDDETREKQAEGEDGSLNAHRAAAAAAGYGAGAGRVEVTHSIVHEGEVNRARYQPQNPNLIATKGPAAAVYVFDRTRHASRPAKGAPFKPDAVLTGHDAEGYGLAWAPCAAGQLLSGSQDARVCLWDTAVAGVIGGATGASMGNAGAGAGAGTAPVRVWEGHTGAVEDVAWHPSDANVFVSCGDDGQLVLWDARQAAPATVVAAHAAEVNAAAFNLVDTHVLATASSDKSAGLWDVRALSRKLHSFDAHADEVFTVAWAPFSASILATGSADRRACVWDLTAIGQEQDAEDAEDGPPELLFMHAGHTSRLVEVAWCPSAPWVLASAADDNVLQVWQVAAAVREGADADDDEEDEDEDEEGEGGVDRADLE